MALRGGMATVDRITRRSLALRRTVRKVQGIRVGERAKIRSKRTGVLGETGVEELSYEYDDRNLGCALLYLGDLFHLVRARPRTLS
jgi:hypothetical protein